MFENRQHAGELLSVKIPLEISAENALVLGIARGGVVVAKEVADALYLPLSLIVVKKIGSPESPELAIGAVGPGQVLYLDQQMLVQFSLTRKHVKELVSKAQENQQNVEQELSSTIQ